MNGRVNDRQLQVLRWIADDCPPGQWPADDFSHRISASALKSRGLIQVKGHGKSWTATVTEAGTHYLEHGSYPESTHRPNPKQSAARARRDKPGKSTLADSTAGTLKQAEELIAQLQASEIVTITDPDESTRARYRRVLHSCRVHHLVPSHHELCFTGRSTGDIVIMLSDGSPAAKAAWDRIKTTARTVTTNLSSLRNALETTSILNEVSESLRPRCIEIVIELAAQLRTYDLKLGTNIKLKNPKLFVQAQTRRQTMTIAEILDQTPYVPTAAELKELRRNPWKQLPQFDSAPSGLLSLKVERDGNHEVKVDHRSYRYERNFDSWSETRKKSFERQIREISHAIKQGVVEDNDARERAEQQRAKAHEAHLREQAAKRRAWEEVRTRAVEKAVLQRREVVFEQAFESWQAAQELRIFAMQLEVDATERGVLDRRPRLQEWLVWARARADDLDPIVNLEHLDDGVFEAEPSADDLRPYMEGWDPAEPHKDYSLGQSRPSQQAVPEARLRAWHPGMRGVPKWRRR